MLILATLSSRRQQGIALAMGLILCTAVMMAALFLGGGTRPGFLADAVLQMSAIPLLVYAIWQHWEAPRRRSLMWIHGAVLAIVAIPVLQLIPLPANVWQLLPNRAILTETFDLIGQPRPNFPLSVTPRETRLAALSLIPPIAIFLGTLLLSCAQRRSLTLAIVGLGILSMILGLLQVGQGSASPLRFFAFTNTDDAVGFFANRNHFAALNYSLTLLLGAWVVVLISGQEPGRGLKAGDSSRILYLSLGLTAFATQIATQALTRSRMGLILMLVAMAAVIALSFKQRQSLTGGRAGKVNNRGSSRLLLLVAAFGIVIAGQYALYAALERFMGLDPMKDGRIAFARNTIEAALAFMPWGAGVGSFVSVYPSFEKVTDLMSGTFANRAHNDFLEVCLVRRIRRLARDAHHCPVAATAHDEPAH
jgi:hypothetical protein